MKQLLLRTGDHGVGRDGDILSTSGVGSCVVVCLWDRIHKIGGMAHMLLPCDDTGGRDFYRPVGMSPDTAIPALIKKMCIMGSSTECMEARLVGAGNMFESETKGFMADIGTNILETALSMLSLNNIIVHSMSVGGKHGRRVEFNTQSGAVVVTKVNGEKSFL